MQKFAKRCFDIAAASILILATLPLQLFVAALVKIKLGSPVIFRQSRAGYAGRPFVMIKFRTMTDARDPDGRLLSDAARLTPFGKLLRKTSLDELPELYNVLRGDMSLVGPRPLHLSYNERYSDFQRRRLEVKPGITGWAQVNGRNALSWEKRFEHDVWYVDHWSIALDLQILFQTLIEIFRTSGINQPGHATSEEFMGNDSQSRKNQP
jgi:lipopolysaccharide/colanic/teichoic acid biosynthesis glycosyltransferase